MFGRKKKEPEPQQTVNSNEAEPRLDEEAPEPDEKTKDTEETDLGAIENLDVEGYWNKRFRKADDYLENGGLMSTIYGEVDGKEIEETIKRAEQDIIDLKLSMVNMKEGVKLGQSLIKQFNNMRSKLGPDVYARLLLGLRHSCTKEVQIGFHEPSFSEWNLPIEDWVDDEYLRRLQGIDVASADWKEGVDK